MSAGEAVTCRLVVEEESLTASLDAAGAPGATHFSHLYAPGRIGAVALRNRAIVSPMTRASATPEGRATPKMVDYYAEYARNGWGLVYTEAVYIDQAYSQGYLNQPGVASDAQRDAWQPVAEACHRLGTPIFMQLFHAGAVNQGNRWVEGSIAPSAVRPKGEQIARYAGSGLFQVPREITRDEMREVVVGFVAAARRAVAAGFDGIEVHGANGYLPDQFLTTYTNLRTDEYGGPVANRVRFHTEIMRAVRDALPAQVPVGVRISQTKVNDLEYSWPGGVADAAVVFPALQRAGVDFIHVSAHLGCHPVFDSGLSLAGLAKKFTGLTVIANGKLQDPGFAEEVLAKGECDFCAIAKGALADPGWPAKVRAGETPIPFDPGMTNPLATLDNTAAWRKRQAA
jgi:2,4-dienoyl-CoA reductase-like NADH-dependent reductase (Old Yellow Enzyme family)